MHKITHFVLLSTLAVITLAGLSRCARRQEQPQDPAIWKKIALDFKQIDEQGLSGPPDGKTAVNYEFCIPAEAAKWKEVSRIDPSAQKHAQSKGRVQCGPDQWLVIGSTHQPGYKLKLYKLASLPYVSAIQQTFWE
ncbi:MAG: hypothetical protein ACK4NS_00765 [Saprospiraceae bacterium]